MHAYYTILKSQIAFEQSASGWSRSLFACPSRLACTVDSKLAAMRTMIEQHAAVELRRTTIVELRELPKYFKVLAAHLDSHLHRLGVRVIVVTVLFVCREEGVEFEQKGADVGVLIIKWQWFPIGRSDALNF